MAIAAAVVAVGLGLPSGPSSLRASDDKVTFSGLADPAGLVIAARVTPPPPPAPAEPTLAELSIEVIRLTNLERTKAGLAPFIVDAQLTAAAQTHALDQRERPCQAGYLTHTGTDGSSPGDRILRTGMSISRWAENVACAFRSPEAVVRGWMGSPGHRANILNPLLTHIGVAIDESSSGRRYWVQDFGTPR